MPGVAPAAVPAAVRGSAGLLARQDLTHVGGGSATNMLPVWRVHGIDRVLADALALLSGTHAPHFDRPDRADSARVVATIGRLV